MTPEFYRSATRPGRRKRAGDNGLVEAGRDGASRPRTDRHAKKSSMAAKSQLSGSGEAISRDLAALSGFETSNLVRDRRVGEKFSATKAYPLNLG